MDWKEMDNYEKEEEKEMLKGPKREEVEKE